MAMKKKDLIDGVQDVKLDESNLEGRTELTERDLALLNLNSQRSAALESKVRELELRLNLIRSEIEIYQLKKNNEIRELMGNKDGFVRRLEDQRRENINFMKALQEKYKLKDKWGYDPENGKIFSNEE